MSRAARQIGKDLARRFEEGRTVSAQHTPGPWRSDYWDVYARDGRHVCKCTATGAIDETHPSIANARLIAAAPDMLAALVAAVQAHGPFGDDSRPEWWQPALDAIAKAEVRE